MAPFQLDAVRPEGLRRQAEFSKEWRYPLYVFRDATK
jgi:hypothetical protein